MTTLPSVLVLSFTGLIRAMRDLEVTDEQLASAIFYLGCGESHAKDPWSGQPSSNELNWFFKNDVDAAKHVHGRIVFALLEAERDARILYRQPNRENSFILLNVLLEAHGLKPILPSDKDDREWFLATHHWGRPVASAEAIKANPGLTVIGD